MGEYAAGGRDARCLLARQVLATFSLGERAFSLSFWGVANLDGVPAYAAILPMVVGLIAAMSGLFWVESERGVEQPDGAIESRFPIGHMLCGCLFAIAEGP